MRVLCALLAGLAGALALVPCAGAGEVSCDGFALGYDGEAKQKTCKVEDTSTGDLTSEAKVLDVLDHAFSLNLVYEHTGFRTYLPARSPTALLKELSGFDRITPIGSERHLRGFDVIAFDATPRGEAYVLLCALFVRYSGNPGNYELPGGPGAKDAVRGVYCAEPGFLPPSEQGQGFYTVVDQTIARLRLPPAD